jgi:enoyl-CoA hydratase/carnithine racemase
MATVQAERRGSRLRIHFANAARRNAIDSADWEELAALFSQAASDPSLDVVSLSGEGPVFCAGVDRSMLAAADSVSGAFASQVTRVADVVHQFETLPALTIAALNGPAIGIGVHLALAADFTLATRDCFLWLPEAALGIPDVQHHDYLLQRLGKHRALEFSLLGRKIQAEEARESGLIGSVWDDAGSLSSALDDLVARISGLAPLVRRGLKAATLTNSCIGNPRAQARVVSTDVNSMGLVRKA